MSICVRARRDLIPREIETLDEELTRYYRNPPEGYYEIADQAAEKYTPERQPFHCELISHVEPGMRVLELGCGTAHLCPHIQAREAHYTGADHSPNLLAENRRRFPQAEFFAIGSPLPETFDLVTSLYTLEHVVDPPEYLNSLWQACKPGGLIGIICPEFIDAESFPPSFYFGRTPRRLRQKLTSLALGDAAQHIWELTVAARKWRAQARAAAPGAFWINLKPRVLHGAAYSIDGDAVHLTRLKDIRWWFEKRGATVVQSSEKMTSVPPDVIAFNCYILLRKPSNGEAV